MCDSKMNKDIIDFRYKLIDKMYGDHSNMDSDTLRVYNELLTMYNIHFSERGYDIG